jgi:hypothetical protein
MDTVATRGMAGKALSKLPLRRSCLPYKGDTTLIYGGHVFLIRGSRLSYRPSWFENGGRSSLMDTVATLGLTFFFFFITLEPRVE